MATLKRIEKIVRENAFDEKKKRPGLKFNPGLEPIGLRTTGPSYPKYQNFPVKALGTKPLVSDNEHFNLD